MVLHKRACIVLAVAIGVVLEVSVALISGRREAWDADIYWTRGMPLALAATGAIGFLSRGRDWRWTALVMPAQFAAMGIRSGEIGALWALGVMLSVVLSFPFVGAAWLGSKLRRRPKPAPAA